jgi:hypothetical protein
MQPSERDLSRKLLAKYHLSVPERSSLRNGRARFSVLVAAVQDALNETGWFPFEWTSGRDLGEGAAVELRGGEIWVHEQHEIGVQRYSPVQSFRVADVAAAVRVYISANGGSPIDGVEVDWHS